MRVTEAMTEASVTDSFADPPRAARTGPERGDDIEPVLPARSDDDTDVGWGEEASADPDDGGRCYAEDRPPHWER